MTGQSPRALTHAGLILLLSALATACGRPPQEVVGGDDWQIGVSTSPQTPVALRSTVITLRITDRDGKALEIAGLDGFAGMPEMEHGESRLSFSRTGPGAYEVTHAFSMDGKWGIRLVGRQAGSPFRAGIAISVGP